MSDPSSLAIVIVSYNVRDELDACLRSLRATGATAAQIIVVDNASRDGTPQMLREQWPLVRVVELEDNVGFARANNVGIRATSSEYVLLLNPDTVVQPGAIAAMLQTLDARPDAAAVGPRLVDGDGVAELSFGWAIGPLGELRQKVVGALHQRGVSAVRQRVEQWTRQAGTRQWVSGACVLIRRRDLEAVGLLDERFFMYTEDVDLCVTLRKQGRAILFTPDATVIHLRGRSAGRNPRTERVRRESQLAYYDKHHPAWHPLLRLYLQLTGKLSSGRK